MLILVVVCHLSDLIFGHNSKVTGLFRNLLGHTYFLYLSFKYVSAVAHRSNHLPQWGKINYLIESTIIHFRRDT